MDPGATIARRRSAPSEVAGPTGGFGVSASSPPIRSEYPIVSAASIAIAVGLSFRLDLTVRPVGQSSTVKSDGSLASGGANPASGYSLIEASSLEDAHQKAKGCPLLKAGGTVEIAQAMDM